MLSPMRPPSLFPLFAEVSTLKGVGPKILPLVQKLAGPLVRDLLFLSPSGLIVRRPMTAVNAVEGQVGVFEVVVDRLLVPGKPGVPIKVRATDDTGFVHLIWFGGSAQHIDRLLPKGQRRLASQAASCHSGSAGACSRAFWTSLRMTRELSPWVAG